MVPSTKSHFCLIAASLLGCLLYGCGPSGGPRRASVEGTVTLDGEPIEHGSIAFYPDGDTEGMVAGGEIRDGRYSISADKGPVIGQNRIEIHASRKTGKKIPDPYGGPGQTIDESVEAVPECYNAKSTLRREVQPGSNVFDCELSSQ